MQQGQAEQDLDNRVQEARDAAQTELRKAMDRQVNTEKELKRVQKQLEDARKAAAKEKEGASFKIAAAEVRLLSSLLDSIQPCSCLPSLILRTLHKVLKPN